MTLGVGRIVVLAIGGWLLFGLNSSAQPIDYGRLPTLEDSLGRDAKDTLEKLRLNSKQWQTVERIMEYEAVQLQMTYGNSDLSVAKRLVRAQEIRYHARQQMVAILTGEQRERLTKLMLQRALRAENRLDDF